MVSPAPLPQLTFAHNHHPSNANVRPNGKSETSLRFPVALWSSRPRAFDAARASVISFDRGHAMPLKIKMYSDFICPFCYIVFEVFRKLKPEFDLELDWRGF